MSEEQLFQAARQAWASYVSGLLSEFLTQVESVRDTRDMWNTLPDEALTEDAVHLEKRVLDQLIDLEEGLLEAALDPKLAEFLSEVLKEVTSVAGGRA